MSDNPFSFTSTLPFYLSAPLDWGGLRKAFADSEYTLEMLSEFAGVSALQSAWDMAVALRRTSKKPRLNALIRLFLFGMPVPRADAETALGEDLVESFILAGLLRVQGSCMIDSECSLLPYRDVLIVHDFGALYTARRLERDHVIAVGDATMLLAWITPRVQVKKALDLGTGSGFQAMLASRHARNVVATDINPRALGFARLSLAMNGLDNIELRRGSYFEPVQSELFDLIVSNPPFVISPDTAYTYRDSGIGGNELCGRVVGGTIEHLQESGFGVLLLNWSHDGPDDWSEPVLRWVENRACDALLLRFATQSPLDYAAGWLSDEFHRSPKQAEKMLDRWLGHFEKQGIGRISWGGLILKKRSGVANWFRNHDGDKDWRTGERGEQIIRIFRNLDMLSGILEDRNLLDERFRIVPEHLLTYSLEAERGEGGIGGGWKNLATKLHLTHGLQFVANTDRNFATILAGLDGIRPFKTAIDEFAAAVGQPPETLYRGCIEAVKPLLEGGFLETADPV
jgi:methylase of polypeptide subunit release factors